MPDQKTVVNKVKKQLTKPVEIDKNKTAPSCKNCPYFHPEFKYRTCLFSICPFGKSQKCIFRSRPLLEDGFSLRMQRNYKAVIRSA